MRTNLPQMRLPDGSEQRPDDRHAICVFASSSDAVTADLRRTAAALGDAIAQRGWRLVYGGGQVGLMGEMARAALSAGGVVTGVIPTWLNRREIAFDAIDDLVEVSSMYERKALMDIRSDAFVALPGGIGTLDELLDLLTTRQLGQHGRPLVLLDSGGFWQPLLSLLQHMEAHGMLRQDTIALLQRVADVDAAVDQAGPGPR